MAKNRCQNTRVRVSLHPCIALVKQISRFVCDVGMVASSLFYSNYKISDWKFAVCHLAFGGAGNNSREMPKIDA